MTQNHGASGAISDGCAPFYGRSRSTDSASQANRATFYDTKAPAIPINDSTAGNHLISPADWRSQYNMCAACYDEVEGVKSAATTNFFTLLTQSLTLIDSELGIPLAVVHTVEFVPNIGSDGWWMSINGSEVFAEVYYSPIQQALDVAISGFAEDVACHLCPLGQFEQGRDGYPWKAEVL